MNWHTIFFYLFALLTCGMAIAVALSRNIVRMAFYLILSLGATSGLFFLAGADFVGAMQLMIYVGGTLVLLIFGVMLTAQGPFVSMKTGGDDWIVTVIVGGSLFGLLAYAATGVEDWRRPNAEASAIALAQPSATTAPIGVKFLGIPSQEVYAEKKVKSAEGENSADSEKTPVGAEGKKQEIGYLLPFEIISVHLVVVLIGAAYLARPKRRVDPQTAT